MVRRLALVFLLMFLMGCGDRERIAQLEKQAQELQAKLEAKDSAVDIDTQAKCSRASEEWFNRHWRRDKTTVLLDYQNHFNKKLGQCFVLVQFHYYDGGGPSWYGDDSLWNIFENSQVGTFTEYHFITYKPRIESSDRMIDCRVYDKSCKTVDEFNDLVRVFLTD